MSAAKSSLWFCEGRLLQNFAADRPAALAATWVICWVILTWNIEWSYEAACGEKQCHNRAESTVEDGGARPPFSNCA